tara:strand:+ start:5084 stop:5752 length:669 start_codon:yes stop_codon:yes gene_type:complete
MSLNISKLEKHLKIKIKEESIFYTALTHKSSNKLYNNEKLEFLGDRVLGLVIAKKLIDLYPDESEGSLDKRFAMLVNKKTCSSIAWNNQINEFIIIGNQKKNISSKDEKILSDLCEAIIGAIYVDRGFNYARDFILRLWKNEITKSSVTILDPKTKLQEYSLKNFKKLPIYKLVSNKGPRHNPTFKVTVAIKGTDEFFGFGSSIKEAEQQAANKLLKKNNIN